MIKILDATHRPIQHIGKMAGVCYGSSTENETKNYNRGISCIQSNHNRTFEYVDVTIEIDGYSNRVIRELYTHIIGVTRLQESTRYVDMSKRFTEYYTPREIEDNPRALEAYNDTMWVIKNAYEFLLELGIKKENAGNLVPLGQHTKIVLKINLEALFHLFATRTCTRVLPEFRDIMREMRNVLASIDSEWGELSNKYFMTKCDKLGFCPEEESCGRHSKKNEYKIIDIKPINIPYADPLKQQINLKLTGINEMAKVTCGASPVLSGDIVNANTTVIATQPNGHQFYTTNTHSTDLGTTYNDLLLNSNHPTPYKPILEREEFWDVSSVSMKSLEQLKELALHVGNSIDTLISESNASTNE